MKDCIRFYIIFLLTLGILFLPFASIAYKGTYSILTGSIAGYPGMGLTYWSVCLVLPISVKAAIAVSTALLILTLSLIYWKSSRLASEKPFYNLAATELSCILAIFLTYRMIAEQYFVWALPFIVIACIEGRVEKSLYWTPSILALIYSIPHSIQVFLIFLVLCIPRVKEVILPLVSMVRLLIKPGGLTVTVAPPFSAEYSAYLTILGSVFSILIVLLLLETLFKPNQRIMKNLFLTRLEAILHKLNSYLGYLRKIFERWMFIFQFACNI
jgi:hypothetical protein